MGLYAFSRRDFVQFIKEHPAKTPFDPTDLRAVPYRERDLKLAQIT